jgi:hypothetical protein
MAISPVYANSSNQPAALKELYVDDKDYMKNIVYAKNPFLALVPKNESPDGFAGKYIPVPKLHGHFKSSLIDLEARQGDRAQAKAA